MLTIRFQRLGKKGQPRLRLVAIEARSKPKLGKPREILGWWDPSTREGAFQKERIAYWRSVGAVISDTAWNRLVSQGVIHDAKRPVKIGKKKKVAEGEAKKEVKTPAA